MFGIIHIGIVAGVTVGCRPVRLPGRDDVKHIRTLLHLVVFAYTSKFLWNKSLAKGFWFDGKSYRRSMQIPLSTIEKSLVKQGCRFAIHRLPPADWTDILGNAERVFPVSRQICNLTAIVQKFATRPAHSLLLFNFLTFTS